MAEAAHDLWFEAETIRLRGELVLQIGDPVAAEAGYQAAMMAVARRQGAKLLELRSAASLARLWRDRGQIADAQVRRAERLAYLDRLRRVMECEIQEEQF